MNSVGWPERVRAGVWSAERASGELSGPGGVQRLEPKVMDLLCLLAREPGQVWSRDELMAALWPGLVVGDDSLARTVSKLRQALGDDAREPRYIETIAKRGYRWIASSATDAPRAPAPIDEASARAGGPAVDREVGRTASAAVASVATPRRHRLRVVMSVGLLAVLALAIHLGRGTGAPSTSSAPGPGDTAVMLARADNYYFQFSRADNEAALELYQRVLGLDPDHPAAMAGLANALAQRAIRWPTAPGPDAVEFTRLGDALAHGHMAREPARSQLQRARQLAEAAVARAPDSAAAHKALGLVLSAQGDAEAGLRAHRRAVELDPEAWGAMINIADLLEQLQRHDEAFPWFERAYEAMARAYDSNPVQVRRWHEALGVLIADRHRARGDLPQAEAGYRRVLTLAPLHPDATRGLAAVLSAGGDQAAADRLCQALQVRLGPEAACTPGDRP